MQNSGPPDDTTVIAQILDGNVDAFEHIVAAHGDRVLSIVRKHVPAGDIEETVQDVFVRAYKSLALYEGTGGLGGWLSSIATAACCDYWRKVYNRREKSLSGLSERHREWLERAVSDQSERSWEVMGRRQEAKEILDWALSHMPAEDRMVVSLVHLEQLSIREAAAMLGWSAAKVKVRAFRARRKLRDLLTRQEEGL